MSWTVKLITGAGMECSEQGLVDIPLRFDTRDAAEWWVGRWKQTNQCHGEPFVVVEVLAGMAPTRIIATRKALIPLIRGMAEDISRFPDMEVRMDDLSWCSDVALQRMAGHLKAQLDDLRKNPIETVDKDGNNG